MYRDTVAGTSRNYQVRRNSTPIAEYTISPEMYYPLDEAYMRAYRFASFMNNLWERVPL